jgi:lincosamide nucleotidyltransferase A/C/D/E
VLNDQHGREIDVHTFILDAHGSVKKESCTRRDRSAAQERLKAVRCVATDWMVKFHCGHRPKEKDYKDVSGLCEKFGLSLPDEYLRFTKSS